METLTLRWNRLSLEIRKSSDKLRRIDIGGLHSAVVSSVHHLTRVIDRSIFGTSPPAWDRMELSTVSDFTNDVLKAVSSIPSGEVRSYGWVADLIDRSGASQAVGQALRGNPFPLLIPCHRIVKSDGSTGGYRSNQDSKIKKYLLNLEEQSIQEISNTQETGS